MFLDDYDIFLISCHSAICDSYKVCESKKQDITIKDDNKDITIPAFVIPPQTFLLSLTAGGEFCLPPIGLHNQLTDLTNLRNLFLLDDLHELELQKEHPLLAGMRATSGQIYPNLICDFEEPPKIVNELGVYRLNENKDHIQRVTSDANPYPEHKFWFLEDLIKNTYEKLKIDRGIFIFAGCTGNLHKTMASLESNDIAVKLIYLANESYNSLVTTKKIYAYNIGANKTRVTQLSPLEIIDLAIRFGNPIELWADGDQEEIDNARDILLNFMAAKPPVAHLTRFAAQRYQMDLPKFMAHFTFALSGMDPPPKVAILFGVFPGIESRSIREANKIYTSLVYAGANPP